MEAKIITVMNEIHITSEYCFSMCICNPINTLSVMQHNVTYIVIAIFAYFYS